MTYDVSCIGPLNIDLLISGEGPAELETLTTWDGPAAMEMAAAGSMGYTVRDIPSDVVGEFKAELARFGHASSRAIRKLEVDAWRNTISRGTKL